MHFFLLNKNEDGITESIHFYLLCNNAFTPLSGLGLVFVTVVENFVPFSHSISCTVQPRYISKLKLVGNSESSK